MEPTSQETRLDPLTIETARTKEVLFQTEEKDRHAAELVLTDIERTFRKKEKKKHEIASQELKKTTHLARLDSKYSRSLIEASRDPLVTISPQGIITDMNEAMVSVTGFTREQLKDTEFKYYFTDPARASALYEEVFVSGFLGRCAVMRFSK